MKKRKAAKKAKKKTTSRKTTSTTKTKPVDSWRVVDRLQLAKLIGVHPDTISDYTRLGMPVIAKGGGGKKSAYDAVDCLKWWRTQQGQDKKEAAQTRAYEAQARLNELKIARQNGELLPRDEVILAGQSYTKAWATKVRSLPRQLVQHGVIPKNRESAVAAILQGLLLEISSWKSIPEVKDGA